MSVMILNAGYAKVMGDVDTRIFKVFDGCSIQYGDIPDQLYLADPEFITHTPIVIVQTDRNSFNRGGKYIHIGFYHPLLTDPAIFLTDEHFEYVYEVGNTELRENGFNTDIDDPSPTEEYFNNLFKTYSIFTHVDASIKVQLLKDYTIPVEYIELH